MNCTNIKNSPFHVIKPANRGISQVLGHIYTNSPKSPDAGRWSGPHCAAADRCGPLEEKGREPTQNNKCFSHDTGKRKQQMCITVQL